MALLLKNAHVIDPQVGLNETADILIRDGKIVEIGQGLPWRRASSATWPARSSSRAWWICMCICASPGFEQKEDIASGTAPQPMAASRLFAPCPTPTRS